MARPTTTESGKPKVPVPLRLDPARLPLIERAREARGMSRQAWLERVVDRALEGAGLLDRGTSAPSAEPCPVHDRPLERREVEPRFGGKLKA